MSDHQRSKTCPFHIYAGMPVYHITHIQIKPTRGGQPQVQEVQQEEEKEADNSAASLPVIKKNWKRIFHF